MHLRIMTYNIHKCIGGVDRKYRPERIIETIRHYEPDVALLQEVDDGVPRSNGHRQVDYLADALDFEHRVFQPNVKLRKGCYGNAVLSHFPLHDTRHLDLTIPLKKRRQAILTRCRIKHGGHQHTLVISTFHLGLAGFERKMQLRKYLLWEAVRHVHHHTPMVVGGDFNDVWGTLCRRLMTPAGFAPAGRKVKTFPASMPMRPLDRIFFRGDAKLVHSFVGHTKIAKQASDHLPFIAEFRMFGRE